MVAAAIEGDQPGLASDALFGAGNAPNPTPPHTHHSAPGAVAAAAHCATLPLPNGREGVEQHGFVSDAFFGAGSASLPHPDEATVQYNSINGVGEGRRRLPPPSRRLVPLPAG